MSILTKSFAVSTIATAALLGATAAGVSLSARKTEREHPPAGKFIDVAGVRMHYLDEGHGPPLVLVHGNVVSSEDFVASGLVERLAKRYRVIAFDRPGFGYTTRPRGIDWTPERQAELLHAALTLLGIERPIVVGHSLGALVTVAFAIGYPREARALVLLSGYYFSATPFGLPLLAVPAMPVVSDVLGHTIAPVLSRLTSGLLERQLFAPAPVAASFKRYPLAMSRRPGQIQATTEDANFLDPAARALQDGYGELALPVEILVGDGDEVVPKSQSERLARALPNAHFETIGGAGHMIHHIAPERVIRAIERVDERSRQSANGVAAQAIQDGVPLA